MCRQFLTRHVCICSISLINALIDYFLIPVGNISRNWLDVHPAVTSGFFLFSFRIIFDFPAGFTFRLLLHYKLRPCFAKSHGGPNFEQYEWIKPKSILRNIFKNTRNRNYFRWLMCLFISTQVEEGFLFWNLALKTVLFWRHKMFLF